jgi:RNA polymerase sigma factor (sigma-70 family)
VSAAPSLDPSGQPAPAPPALGADSVHALFERHSAAIYGYCYNRLGGREEAEDAVQTTFLNAFRALRRGVVPEYESAWLHKIAENVCHGRHRSARRRLEVVQDPTTIAEAAPAAQAGSDELFGLDQALEQMAPRQRRALLLREWRGLSYREIGQELRLSPGAVETLLFRARRSLARNLQVGSLIPWLKSVVSGSAAVKAAAAAGVVVAATATLGGDAPIRRDARPTPSAVRPAVATPTSDEAGSSAPGAAPTSEPSAQTPAAGRRVRPTGRARATKPRTPPKADQPGQPTPAGEVPGAATPVAEAPTHTAAPSTRQPPATLPGLPSPPPPPGSLPVQIPPAPPPPSLPELPQLPQLPQVPGLPPLPPPALPPPPPLPQLPAVPEVPKLPELPQPPKLP